jgi:hypothetical protein
LTKVKSGPRDIFELTATGMKHSPVKRLLLPESDFRHSFGPEVRVCEGRQINRSGGRENVAARLQEMIACVNEAFDHSFMHQKHSNRLTDESIDFDTQIDFLHFAYEISLDTVHTVGTAHRVDLPLITLILHCWPSSRLSNNQSF